MRGSGREAPRLRQARADDGRPHRPHRGRAGDRGEAPRLRGQPARGVRRRGGRTARRAARRRVGRAHARAGGGRGAAARRDGDRHRPRAAPRHRRRGVGPRGDRRRDPRGDPGRRGGVGPVRPRLLRQRVGRLGRLPGRATRRARPRPPLRHRAQGRCRRGSDGPLRAGARRAAATSTSCRSRRSSPCSKASTCRATPPYPAGCGRGRSRSTRPRRRGRPPGSSGRASSSRRESRSRPRCSAGAPEAAPAVVELLRQIGVAR